MMPLLLINLHKFYNKHDIPWVNLVWEKHYGNGKLPSHIRKGSFWWRDILKLIDKFKGMAVLQDGTTCMLWEDQWHDQIAKLAYPHLHSFVKNTRQSISAAVTISPLSRLFHLPLSTEAFQEMQELQQQLDTINIMDTPDIWTYIWGTGSYSSSKAYKHLIGHAHVHPAYKWIWKTSCQHKHKVFAWLLLKDRLSTRGLLQRKNMTLQSYHCVLCADQIIESRDHLFLSFPFL